MCCQKTFDRTRALFYQVQIHYHNCYLCEEKFVAQIVSVSMMSLDKITIKSSVETVLRGILEGHCHVGVFIIAYLGRSAFNSHFKQISIPETSFFRPKFSLTELRAKPKIYLKSD